MPRVRYHDAMSDTATQRQRLGSPSGARDTRNWRDFFREPLRRVEAESRAYLATEAARRPDRKVIVVLVTAALCLTVQHFVALEEDLIPVAQVIESAGLRDLADDFREAMWTVPAARLNRLTWWAVICMLTYVAVPALVVRLVFRERLRDYGVKLGGVLTDFWVYVMMMGFAWPAIFAASATTHFQLTYPFYRLAPGEGAWPRLTCWELLYMGQFFGVEFFFRGFLLHGLRQRFGAYAIFVMMVPYCMLHFAKPLPEALASIVGAVALGFMSLRTRSIWMGTAIHVTVAWSMDAASLWRQGFFG
jgi:membrane protease YdiL (CAAX protease family)